MGRAQLGARLPRHWRRARVRLGELPPPRPGGEYADPAEPLPDGAVVVVGAELLFPDGGRVAVTETVTVESP